MKFTYIFLFLVFALTIPTWAQDQPGDADWKTLTTEEFEIKYPADWSLDQSGQMGTSFILMSLASDSSDLFRENVNLVIQDLSGLSLTLDKYVELSTQQIQRLATNGKIIQSERIEKKELAYHKMVYTADQGIYKLQFVQYYWIIGEQAYVLTLTCSQDQFAAYQEVGMTILDSFSIKED